MGVPFMLGAAHTLFIDRPSVLFNYRRPRRQPLAPEALSTGADTVDGRHAASPCRLRTALIGQTRRRAHRRPFPLREPVLVTGGARERWPRLAARGLSRVYRSRSQLKSFQSGATVSPSQIWQQGERDPSVNGGRCYN